MKHILTSLLLSASLISAHAYDVLVDGIYYNLNSADTTAEVTESGAGYYAGDITIPSSITHQSTEYTVTSIGKKAFRQNTTLTSVSIPATVTRICDFAFAECTGLTTITLPAGIDSIGNYAFAHSGITHSIISGNMFAYMPESYQGKYTIPDTITHICGAAFTNCTNMTGVTLPDGLEYIGYAAFGTCSTLASVTIPNSVTFIGEYAFNECVSLVSATLPESLTEIAMCAFYSCVSLTKITIPETVRLIDRFAFCYCPYLAQVKCYPTTPPTCGQYAFDQISEEAILFVPKGTVPAYRRISGYSDYFANIYEMGGVGVGNTAADGVDIIASCGHIMVHGAEGSTLAVYSADGRMVSRIGNATAMQVIDIPGAGVYFVRYGNGQTQRVVVK